VEARLTAQAAVLYANGMRYLARAEQAELLDHSEHFLRHATKLLRLHNETTDALSRYRRRGEQRVVVQHQYVQVNEGGSALVAGQFVHGSGEGERTKNGIPHG